MVRTTLRDNSKNIRDALVKHNTGRGIIVSLGQEQHECVNSFFNTKKRAGNTLGKKRVDVGWRMVQCLPS